jgi:hypothetical protein
MEERYDEMLIALPCRKNEFRRWGLVQYYFGRGFGDTGDGPAKGSLTSSFHRLQYPLGHNVLVRYLCMYVQLAQQTFQRL